MSKSLKLSIGPISPSYWSPPDYLASKWIQEEELPQLLEKHKQRQLRVLPIIVRPALWVQTPLAYYQVWPRDGRAISELPRAKRDRMWADFTEVLVAILHQLEESPPELHVDLAEAQRKTDTGEGSAERTADSPTQNDQTPKVQRTFFISHAKEDGDFAENLKSRMAQAGYTGWIDTDVLEAGTDWRKEIDEAILGSRAVILVLSPDSKASEYVTYEWAYGLGLGLRVVPLLLRETPIHPRLEAFQYLDFTNRRARPWDRLFALLDELVVGQRQPDSSKPPTARVTAGDPMRPAAGAKR